MGTMLVQQLMKKPTPLALSTVQRIASQAGVTDYNISAVGEAGYKFVEYNHTGADGDRFLILPAPIRVGEIIYISSQVKGVAQEVSLSPTGTNTITNALGVVGVPGADLLIAADSTNAFLCLRSTSLTNWSVVHGISSENT